MQPLLPIFPNIQQKNIKIANVLQIVVYFEQLLNKTYIIRKKDVCVSSAAPCCKVRDTQSLLGRPSDWLEYHHDISCDL